MAISWIDTAPLPRHNKVIAVVDVVESVRLMEQDEQEFIRRWHAFVDFVKHQLPPQTGRLHKSLGDGLMMEFSDPHGCIRATLAMQAWFRAGNQDLPPGQHVYLRIGAHVAEFVADEHDIYGTDVNVAARIATLAAPGEIVISQALRARIRGELEDHLEDLGSCHLKHVKQPVHAYRVGRPGVAATPPPEAALRWLLRPFVAVLPFVGASPDEAALGDAIANESVAALSQSAELQVVSRLAAAPFRQHRANLENLAQNLRADYLLRGQVRQAGAWVTVFAELVHTGSGHVGWARTFKGAPEQLLAPGARLVHDLATGATSAIVAHALERSDGQALPALESHTLLMAAIGLMHRLTAPDLERAEEMLEHLVDRNRRHPAVHAWLAHCHVLRLRLGLAPDPQRTVQLAREASRAALGADACFPLALCIDAEVHVHLLKDLGMADLRCRQVLAVRPSDPMALSFHAELLALRGQPSRAETMAQHALAHGLMDQLRFVHQHAAALAAWAGEHPQAAVEHAQACLDSHPSFLPAYGTLAVAQVESGDRDAAHQSLERLLRLQPEFSVARFLAHSPAQPAVARRMAAALAAAGAPPG